MSLRDKLGCHYGHHWDESGRCRRCGAVIRLSSGTEIEVSGEDASEVQSVAESLVQSVTQQESTRVEARTAGAYPTSDSTSQELNRRIAEATREAILEYARTYGGKVTSEDGSDTIEVELFLDDNRPSPAGMLLRQTIVESTEPVNEGALIRAVAIPWLEISNRILSDPSFIYQFSKHPRKFEEFLAATYQKAGYDDVVLTPSSRDMGIDIIVTAHFPGVGRVRLIEQAKAFSENRLVTANDVRALAGTLLRDLPASKGIVTTTSDFAPSIAAEFSNLLPTRLELKNGKQLRDWLKDLVRPRGT